MTDSVYKKTTLSWERAISFFLASSLASAPVLFLGALANPLTPSATTVVQYAWLAILAIASYLYSKVRARQVFLLKIGVILVGLLSLSLFFGALQLARADAFLFAEILVKELRAFEETHGHYPNRGELEDSGACERIRAEWMRVRSPIIRTEAKNCDVMLIGARLVSTAPSSGARPGTVHISEFGPAGGAYKHWDWQKEEWVYTRQ